MAQQIINIGGAPNDGNGDTIRDGGDKVNDNFTELYEKSIDSVIVVKTSSDFGVIDSTKVYVIDGEIDMTGVTVEIPAGGISMVGSTFDISKLVSTDNNYDMFESAVGGCGNILAQDIGFETSGASSQVWNLTSATGFDAFEFAQINYNNCTKVGTLTNFRQGLESGSGRFGGTPTIELVGTWVGGYRITTSIVRGLDAGMTEPLFKAGAGFSMASRFLTDINCDLPALAAFTDFAPSQFTNPSTVQIVGAIFSRDGVFDAADANIFPNMPSTSLSAAFSGNNGIPNTFVGGRNTVTVEVTTTINTQGTFETLLGTFATSDLSHFDSPANGQLRHLGDNPREYRVFADLTMEGDANAALSVRVRKWDDSASSFVDVSTQSRQVNNLLGGRDVALFTIFENVTLDKNDYIFLQITNETNTASVTVELESYFFVDER